MKSSSLEATSGINSWRDVHVVANARNVHRRNGFLDLAGELDNAGSLVQRVEVMRNWAGDAKIPVVAFQYHSMGTPREGGWTGERGGYVDFLARAKALGASHIFLNKFHLHRYELYCAKGYLSSLDEKASAALAQVIAENQSRVGEFCSVTLTALCPDHSTPPTTCARPCTLWMMGDWDPWYAIIRSASDAGFAQDCDD